MIYLLVFCILGINCTKTKHTLTTHTSAHARAHTKSIYGTVNRVTERDDSAHGDVPTIRDDSSLWFQLQSLFHRLCIHSKHRATSLLFNTKWSHRFLLGGVWSIDCVEKNILWFEKWSQLDFKLVSEQYPWDLLAIGSKNQRFIFYCLWNYLLLLLQIPFSWLEKCGEILNIFISGKGRLVLEFCCH